MTHVADTLSRSERDMKLEFRSLWYRKPP